MMKQEVFVECQVLAYLERMLVLSSTPKEYHQHRQIAFALLQEEEV
jgi:hypothetical protein